MGMKLAININNFVAVHFVRDMPMDYSMIRHVLLYSGATHPTVRHVGWVAHAIDTMTLLVMLDGTPHDQIIIDNLMKSLV